MKDLEKHQIKQMKKFMRPYLEMEFLYKLIKKRVKISIF